jgi:predicted Zn-dependent peptidase
MTLSANVTSKFFLRFLPAFLCLAWIALLAFPNQVQSASANKKRSAEVRNQFTSPESLAYPVLEYRIPEAKRIALDNGMILYWLGDHELPIIRMSVLVRTGSAYDPPDQPGLAELSCRAMRTAGTLHWRGDELDDQLDRHAIHISCRTDLELVRFSLNTLKENLEEAVELFSEIMTTPRFDPKKVLIEKELMLEEIRRIEDNPQEFAFREFRKHLYRGNPRGNQKSIPSISGIQVADLADFHHEYFYPENMMIAVTGDISLEETIRVLSSRFPSPSRKHRIAPLPAPDLRSDGRVIIIPKEIPQSVVLAGFAAPAKNTSDYHAFSILDFVLGSGGFRSRIFQEIRNDLGLAYSAGSFYSARTEYGVLSAYSMTKTDTTLRVLDAMKSIITDVAGSLLKPEEVRWAQRSITNNFLFSFANAEQIVHQQMMSEYEGLPEEFLIQYRQNIQKVKPLEIKALAARYLRLDQATILILGDEKGFDHPVRNTGAAIPPAH